MNSCCHLCSGESLASNARKSEIARRRALYSTAETIVWIVGGLERTSSNREHVIACILSSSSYEMRRQCESGSNARVIVPARAQGLQSSVSPGQKSLTASSHLSSVAHGPSTFSVQWASAVSAGELLMRYLIPQACSHPTGDRPNCITTVPFEPAHAFMNQKCILFIRPTNSVLSSVPQKNTLISEPDPVCGILDKMG